MTGTALSLLAALAAAQLAPVADGSPDAGAPPPTVESADAGGVDAGQAVGDGGAPAAAPVEPAVSTVTPPPPPTPTTTGTLGLGFIWLTGNSNTLSLSANLAASHDFSNGLILSGKASAIYGQSEDPTTGLTTVNALAAGGLARADYLFVPETSAYALGGLDADHVASLELREYAEAGAAMFWLDQKDGKLQKLLFRTDVGMRYAVDNRFQYFPDTAEPAQIELPQLIFLGPRLGAVFRYAANKDVIFNEEAWVAENVDGASRTLAASATKLTSLLFAHVSAALGFTVAYDSSPPPGKVSTDTGLTVGLEGSL